MKKYSVNFLILLFLISCKTNKNGYIEFRHVGECDKPIQTLRIVKKDVPSELITKDIIVDKLSFDHLFNNLTEGRKEGKCIDVSHTFGSFQITLSRDTTVDYCYVIDGRKNSLVFFQRILEYLKKNNADEALQKAINVTIQRIEHPAPGFPED